MNALKERELELRGKLYGLLMLMRITADPVGLQIPVIENLASHQGTYDTLNLTDNSITVLGNIPLGEFCSLAFGWGKAGSTNVARSIRHGDVAQGEGRSRRS